MRNASRALHCAGVLFNSFWRRATAALPAPEAPYAVLHARSLRAAKAEPMLAATRALAERFYAPHNEALAKLLGDPALAWPRGSTAVDAARLADAKGAVQED